MLELGPQSGRNGDGFSHEKQKSVALMKQKGEKMRIHLTQLLWVSE